MLLLLLLSRFSRVRLCAPTRLPCPWDSPGKNTGVGCHFLLQCVKVKSESEVTQSYPTLSDPMDCSLPGSSVHGIFQTGVLEWGAIWSNLNLVNKCKTCPRIVLIKVTEPGNCCCCCCCVTSVVSDSVRPHRRQPTRLPRPWDSPGKNTGVGCHFLLQCMKVKEKPLSCVRLLVTPWTAAYQAPPSMGFSSHEYWSGVPLPSPGNCIQVKW